MELVASFELSGFSASASLRDGTLLVEMQGNGDLAVVPALASFVPRVHGAALARGASLVIVDLRAVEFMNSSCIKELVSWVELLLDTEPRRHYRIRLQQGEQHWQKRSLEVLRTFAGGVVDIER